ncbi:LacI family DNA-binding transcriptional regulator [Tepidibacillus fermentans]|uniref:LacI family DNA-binding transcriptional regulator n=1 Tax=Tepidibacillus fermentans TaxID=1281767 RepID=UPI00104429CA|nr:LacI family DNA-binding transcriptional regulator [Tepidibacillus fermentans]
MSVTIKDVAKLANVAPSTVSRVIADSPRISQKTKERVREAMKQLGYHPNLIARSLASQSTQAIGLVMPSSTDTFFQNPFFPSVLRGISEGAHQKHYALYMVTGKTEQEIFHDIVQMVQGSRVDGAILLYSKIEDKIVDYLKENQFPFVVIGKPHKDTEEITHVDNDNVRAAKDGTKYLLSLGHERIGFVGGNPHLVVTIERMQGYKKALEEAGLVVRQEYIIHGQFLIEGGQVAVEELMSLKEPPTALLVADDLMSLGVINKLNTMGIEVPNDISIVSFNNVLLAQVSNPPLTSIDINIFDLGFEAAKNLILKIENPKEPVKRIIIPHELVIRDSCAPFKSNDA